LHGQASATIHLVEATQKKCRFLAEVAQDMGVDVQVHAARAEDLSPLMADVVTARAVAALTELFALVERHLKPDGLALLLKGARANEELTAARRAWDFAVNEVPSRSDSAGKVLCVTGLRRCPKQTKRS
jgi:16S rRNA (guanine527-N7)-methyltransferase